MKQRDLKSELSIWCTPIVVIYGILLFFDIFIVKGQGNLVFDNARLFSSILFFNTTHVVFSFLGIVFIYEISNWWKSFPRKTYFYLLILFLPLLFLIWLYTQSYEQSFLWDFTRVTLIFLSLHHAAMQSYGFLVMGKTVEEKKILRLLFLLMTVLFGVSRYARIFPDFEDYLNKIDYLTFIISSIAVVDIFRRCWNSKEDRFFLIRILLFPLGQLYSIAAIGISAIHGIEYLILIKRQIYNSKSFKKINSYSLSSGLYFTIFLIYLALAIVNERSGIYAIKNMSEFEELGLVMTIIWIFMDGVSLPHYFLDGEMYRFSSSNSRKHILPLLK